METQKNKRYCYTLDLKNNPELIAEYKKYHTPEFIWPEIVEGIKKSGIKVMDIYCVDNRMFMICEVPNDVDVDEAMALMNTFERQGEWHEFMCKFNQPVLGHEPGWVLMDQVFTL